MAVPNPKPPKPIRDAAYTRDAQNRPCMAIWRTDHSGDVIAAHINIAGNFGRSMKAGDDETLDLCHAHHTEMDQYPGQRDRWIIRNVVLPQRRAAYQKWHAAEVARRAGR